ncbi:hypothetical protein NEF87_002483 [Candidatus Lokiarchaeum ossiferum]|uniref:CAAX prenyl protease 2/Lysostaphin resistance protein A-like domain-containing protein n=1 Tax=Candidatus Lokiarchaeum ossiferum TaxID=2951803 RepID=A0ABY6HRQ9_9ARCH|nr:hypothetical protein NEF87_002483 [Candidatus Lokiarchaeum sp. B-35]
MASELNKKNKKKMSPISLFFLLSYTLFWGYLVVAFAIITILSLDPANLPVFAAEMLGIVGSYAPSVAAIIVLLQYNDKQAIKALLKQYINFKASWKLYLLGLLPIVVAFISALIGRIFISNPPEIVMLSSFAPAIFVTLLLDVAKGPIGEQAGWRGFGYAKLMEKQSFLKTGLIIGFFWAFWHAPLWLMNAWSIGEVLGFILTAVATTLFMNWMRFKNQKSLIPVVLFHLSMNFGLQLVTDIGFNLISLRVLLPIYGVVFVILATLFYASNKSQLINSSHSKIE